jgi:hypothetical protein
MRPILALDPNDFLLYVNVIYIYIKEKIMPCDAIEPPWQSASVNHMGNYEGRRRARWSAFEIAAMVLGFVVFWPVGLAILFWILWNKRHGREVTLPGWVPRVGVWGQTLDTGTGNSAFEEWKRAELDRLEEERRKLAAAQAEFQEFLEQLKRAKDREEFDRFLAARGRPGGAQA